MVAIWATHSSKGKKKFLDNKLPKGQVTFHFKINIELIIINQYFLI